jgi:hypothetical protein
LKSWGFPITKYKKKKRSNYRYYGNQFTSVFQDIPPALKVNENRTKQECQPKENGTNNTNEWRGEKGK